MRHLAWLFLLALPALAEGPSDFAGSARVAPSGNDALQRFAIPFEVYRDARRDLADVRVFNAKREAVPMAIASEPETVREAPVMVELPQFAIASVTPGGRPGTELRIRASDGTLIVMTGIHPPAKGETFKTTAYVLDASQLKEPLRALVFRWNAAPGTEIVRVNVESSDDLQAWRGAGGGSLVHLEQGGRVLEQPRIAIAPSKAKYYRVTWSAPAFDLRSVSGEYEPAIKPPERRTVTIAAATPMSTIGNLPPCAKRNPISCYIFDLGGRIPVEAVRLVLAEPNSVAPVYIVVYDGDLEGASRPVAPANFFRLTRDGVEAVSPAIEIGRLPARFIGVQLDPSFPGLGSAWPSLEVQWRPAEVVFVTRGDGPFTLAWGDPDAKPAWTAVSALMPGYKAHDELKLPVAIVRDVASAGPPRGAWPDWAARLGPRKLTLWAVLVLAVVVLAVIAWTLHRQMRE